MDRDPAPTFRRRVTLDASPDLGLDADRYDSIVVNPPTVTDRWTSVGRSKRPMQSPR